jgi:hypothetical protein
VINAQSLQGVDPTGQTDSSAAIQQALSSFTGDGGIYFPYGKYLLHGLTWSQSNRLKLVGDGPSTWLIMSAPTGSLFTATAGFVDIEGFTVYAPVGYVTNGVFFQFSNGTHSLRNIDFFNGYSLASWGAGCAGGGASNIYAQLPTCDGFDVNVSSSSTGQQYGNIYFNRIYFQAGATNNGYGLKLVSGDTIIVSDSNIAGFNVNIAGIPLASASYLANLFFTNVLADGAGGPSNSNCGWYFDGLNQFLARIYMDNSWAGSIGNTGIYMRDVKTARIAGVEVIQNGQFGIILDTGCRDIRIRDCVVTGNSRVQPGLCDGIYVLAGADRVHINGNRSGPTYNGTSSGTLADTQRFGINISDPSVVNYSMTDNDCSGNITSGISDNGGGEQGVTKFVSGNTQGAFSP